ncbi:Transcription-repair coupling factor [Pseudomonas syringae pv. actinidiae]|uniref:Transcription-repair coupling factor n=1 Tax=Pseudomonas syringae pv. actinidiae TaxID=103796 RepID=A0AAN4TQK0_PSESF|nr:Transcription-repair coupling factor [Pseudomonas syringae pv. actinidiae]
MFIILAEHRHRRADGEIDIDIGTTKALTPDLMDNRLCYFTAYLGISDISGSATDINDQCSMGMRGLHVVSVSCGGRLAQEFDVSETSLFGRALEQILCLLIVTTTDSAAKLDGAPEYDSSDFLVQLPACSVTNMR